jgi:hypothetical protein
MSTDKKQKIAGGCKQEFAMEMHSAVKSCKEYTTSTNCDMVQARRKVNKLGGSVVIEGHLRKNVVLQSGQKNVVDPTLAP